MARFMAGGKTAANSTALPSLAVRSGTTNKAVLREAGLFNTTNTAADYSMQRLSTAGAGGGTSVTVRQYDEDSTAGATAQKDYTAAGPTLAEAGYRASLGAAIGAGVIWTFGDTGIRVKPAASSANGCGIVVDNGTGQAIQAYIVWDE